MTSPPVYSVGRVRRLSTAPLDYHAPHVRDPGYPARATAARAGSWGAAGAQVRLGVVGRNSDLGVTWVHSYVSDDKRKTFCVYDGTDPESIRKAAEHNQLPIDRITRVNVCARTGR